METSSIKNINFQSLLLKFLSSDAFAIIFGLVIFEFILIDLVSSLFSTDSTSDSSRIFKALSQILFTIPFSILLYLFTQWKLGQSHGLTNEKSFLNFFKKNISEWILTQVRVFARVIMFFFLLVIPGVIESMRLSFSSLNVLFNENMKNPVYDPVIDSRNKMRPFSNDVLYLFIFTMLLPILISMPFAERSFLVEPVLRLFHAVTVSVGLIFSQCYIFYKFTQFYKLQDLQISNQQKEEGTV